MGLGEVPQELGVNVPWVLGESSSDYQSYRSNLTILREAGVRLFRVWAAPWEVPYGTTVDEYVARRSAHFRSLLEIAADLDSRLIVCLHTHVEFLDERRAHDEIEDVSLAWSSNSLNERCGGPFQRPSQLFENPELTASLALQTLDDERLASRCAAVELMNEVDLVPGYSRAAAVLWARLIASRLQSQHPYLAVTLSAADPWESVVLARRAGMSFATCHFHGWQGVSVTTALAGIQKFAVLSGVPLMFGEVSTSSQNPPSPCQYGEWATLAVRAGKFSDSSVGLLWWVPEVIQNPEALGVLANVLQQRVDAPVRRASKIIPRRFGAPGTFRAVKLARRAVWDRRLRLRFLRRCAMAVLGWGSKITPNEPEERSPDAH